MKRRVFLKEIKMAKKYEGTIKACFIGYIVQAIVNNFTPLLFIRFGTQYNIPLSEITMLITVNFLLQLMMDFASAFFIDRIGYKASCLIAHGSCAAGLIALAVLPGMFANAYIGLLIAVLMYAVGGGLLEVVISPMVEACPSEHKDKTMSMLHSFYCWGTVIVIAFSTLFFYFFGIENWKTLSLIWAILPILNGIAFIFLPVCSLSDGDEEGLSLKELFKTKAFWLFALVICCAGASEQAISQWASAFTEQALGISKTVSDLAGPLLFSVLMGISRTIYGKFGERIDLDKMMVASGALCCASYMLVSLSPSPALALFGMAVCGFSVGILWPGTYSKAASKIKGGGTTMFAFLALAGDVGCTGGPTFAGKIAGLAGDNLKTGISAAVVFPAILTVALLFTAGMKNKKLDR